MKDVDIISKVVARKGEAMASPSKDAAPVNLSGYLLKEVWDKCWEIRTTDQGEEYLFGKYPVAVQYGLTSYVDGKMLKLPSIYDGLPIDYQTLYWEETTNEDGSVTRVLKARGIGNSDGGGGNIPDLSAYVTKEEFAPVEESYNLLSNIVVKHTSDITDIKNTYAKQEWVLEKIAGLSGGGTVDLSIYATRIWVEQNYATLTQVSELSGTVEKKADLSDVYDRSEVDNKVNAKWTADNKKISNWDDAYGWGNHAEAGYVTEDLVSSLLGNKLDKSTFESWVSQNGPKIANGFTAYGWGNHADAGYVKSYNLTEILKGYVTVGGTEMQTITGKKNFAGGLFVNGKEIKYNSDGYWELEGDLLVTGGITSFASSSGFTPSTIMDGVVVDGVTIIKQNGVLVAVGGGSSGDSPDLSAYALKDWVSLNFATSSQLSTLSGTVDNKANTSDVYTKSEVDNKVSAKWTTDSDKISQWDAAYGWGNHAEVGYLTTTTGKSLFVGLTGDEDVQGVKNFVNGIEVNGGKLEYNSQGYWKMFGNLLVTGGITSYTSDGKESPFMVDAASIDLITSESTTQVYTARATKLIKDEVISVGVDASDALAKLAIIAEELSSLTTSSYTADIRTALMNIATKIK